MACQGDHRIRERLEEREESLSPYATRSRDSRGREQPEEPCPMRTSFQQDRDRILHTNAFRRLKHKTQVFIAPTGDHYVTRLTHTLEVSQVARTIARALNLNEDLAEAIGLGHDLGHTPFGHVGEEVLNELYPQGFAHSSQSLRVVDRLENKEPALSLSKAQGLNLTWEVRQGIVAHSKPRGDFWGATSTHALTLEAQVCRIADAVAYLNHDIGDAIRAGMLSQEDVPLQVTRVLGNDLLNTMIQDIVEASWAATGETSSSDVPPTIAMSSGVRQAVNELRDFMFRQVYIPANTGQEGSKALEVVRLLYEHLLEHPQEVPQDYFRPDEPVERAVVDYLAGMTDHFALRMAERIRPGVSGGVFQGLP